MDTITIGQTKKGHRIWIQGLNTKPLGTTGPRFTVVFSDTAITILLGQEGKRAVTQSKGGIIDIESKKVTQWAQGATRASVDYGHGVIVVTRDNVTKDTQEAITRATFSQQRQGTVAPSHTGE